MRLVLDTNVLVAALRSPRGASAQLVGDLFERRFELVANAALFIEYEAVLTRAEHLAVGGVTAADIGQALDDMAGIVSRAERTFDWRPQLVDADDEIVLEAAVSGQADAIVTFEVRTSMEAARRFGVAVVTPSIARAMVRA